MAVDTFFGFDSTDKDDARWISDILKYRRDKASGVPLNLIRRVKRSWVGRTFVSPLAQAMTPGQAYSAAQLAAMLGTSWTAKKVASKLNVLGRPEKRFGVRIFARPTPGNYSLTQAMRDAILDPAN